MEENKMATINANTQLQTGDTVDSLTGLQDCTSGHSINIRLNGKAVPPEGWAAPCQPQTIPAGRCIIVSLEYSEYDGYSGTPYLHKVIFTKQIFTDDATRIRVLESIIPNNFSSIMNGWPHEHIESSFSGTKFFNGPSPGGYYKYILSQNGKYLDKAIPASWPQYIASELIYDAASGLFKPACAEHDPHIPEHLQRERSCLTLCDDEGNRIVIRKIGGGIQVWQKKYQQLARINAQTRQVEIIKQQIVGPERLELKSLTVFLHPLDRQRTRIGVGEGIIVKANQAVEWEIKGVKWKEKERTETKLEFYALDQPSVICVTAKTECEEKDIAFTVIAPTGVKFVKKQLIHTYKVLDAGFVAEIYLLPMQVNFGNLEVCEVQSNGYGGTGLWAGYTAPHGPENDYKDGHGPWGLTAGYSDAHGTNTGLVDIVYGQRNEYCPERIPHSEIHYDIPYKWRLKDYSKEHFLPNVHYSTIIQTNGNVTTKKGNESISFHYLEPSLGEYIHEKPPTPKEKC